MAVIMSVENLSYASGISYTYGATTVSCSNNGNNS